jgi:hypothetical protein
MSRRNEWREQELNQGYPKSVSIPLSTQQFQSKDKPIRTLPTRSIRTDKLVATQVNYIPEKVASIAEKDPETFNEVPIVGKLDGKYHVLDGHHRVAGQILRGDKTMRARIIP